jgi:PKHD-type hydroxylase
MTTLYSRPLLTTEELAEIHQIVQQAQWGRHDSVLPEYLGAHQKNSEMVWSEDRVRISEIAMTAINRDTGFRDLVFPRQSTQIIVSKTEVGQGFKTHHDMPSNGDYSTTIFLSDPATYKGGELTMLLGPNEQKYALPAGYALTYETGLPHCVKEVTEGVRYAIVFWTTSLIRDGHWREVIADLRKVKKMLPRDYGYDLLETTNDPHFIIQGIENKIVRYFLDGLNG